MPPKFGTSGLRGLVVEMTEQLVARYVRAFAANCSIGDGVYVGRDLRDSSPQIAKSAISALTSLGVKVTDCGDVATPALALAAMNANSAAIMITGSHIPADRNGLKFYTPHGEVSKVEEKQILDGLDLEHSLAADPSPVTQFDPNPAFIARYITAFGSNALAGQSVGVYSHSTVGRDMLQDILRGLGADVVELGRSPSFIPVDTEAVDQDTRQQLRDWAVADRFTSIVSMDGDGDRPLLTSADGEVVPGDILGQITSTFLGAKTVVTPVSSNTGVDSGPFDQVVRTRIGSPFVIEGMENAGGSVSGYEANGGYLLGFDADAPVGVLPQLMTRDSVLPIVAVLVASGRAGIAARVAQEPKRFTAADRLQEVPTEASKALVEQLTKDPSSFLTRIDGSFKSSDVTDGLRITLVDGRIVHMRPSGNAPELRLYVEASNIAIAQNTLALGFSAIREMI